MDLEYLVSDLSEFLDAFNGKKKPNETTEKSWKPIDGVTETRPLPLTVIPTVPIHGITLDDDSYDGSDFGVIVKSADTAPSPFPVPKDHQFLIPRSSTPNVDRDSVRRPNLDVSRMDKTRMATMEVKKRDMYESLLDREKRLSNGSQEPVTTDDESRVAVTDPVVGRKPIDGSVSMKRLTGTEDQRLSECAKRRKIVFIEPKPIQIALEVEQAIDRNHSEVQK